MFDTTLAEEKKLEQEALENLERQQRDLSDRYSTEQKFADAQKYHAYANAQSDQLPKPGETYAHYAIRVKTEVDMHYRQNYKIHVEIGTRGKPWHTHKDPRGCFMCDDIQLLHQLATVFEQVARKTPTQTF